MNAIGFAIAALLMASTSMAQAQTQNKIPRFGFLRLTRQSEEPKLGRLEEFRQGLRQLGYIEGQNISLELRWAEDKLVQVPASMMTELVRLNADDRHSRAGWSSRCERSTQH